MTLKLTDTMLVGSDIGAALTALSPYSFVDVIGLNCATGPDPMYEHLRYLADPTSRPISVLPNAGQSENVDGQPHQSHYPLTHMELPRHLSTSMRDYGVPLVVVGCCCCGATPDHLAAVVKAPGALKGKNAPAPAA